MKLGQIQVHTIITCAWRSAIGFILPIVRIIKQLTMMFVKYRNEITKNKTRIKRFLKLIPFHPIAFVSEMKMFLLKS